MELRTADGMAAGTAAVQRQESELLQRIAEAELGELQEEENGVSAKCENFHRTEPCLIPRMLGLLLGFVGRLPYSYRCTWLKPTVWAIFSGPMSQIWSTMALACSGVLPRTVISRIRVLTGLVEVIRP